MIVVEVLTISCQVSEKPKNGPLQAQMTNRPRAITNTQGRPKAEETAVVKRVKISGFLDEITV